MVNVSNGRIDVLNDWNVVVATIPTESYVGEFSLEQQISSLD